MSPRFVRSDPYALPLPKVEGYLSSTGNRQLTPKEKEARRQVKQANNVTVKTADFGFPTDNLSGANTVMSGGSNFFNPQISPDFFQLPQSARERREIYKHFYDSHPLVGTAIDLHTELPLSKIRLTRPKPRNFPANDKRFKTAEDYGRYILYFFEKMCDRLNLLTKLISSVHHLHLDGGCYLFLEDGQVEVPYDVGHAVQADSPILNDDGTVEYRNSYVPLPNRDDREMKYYVDNYRGWERMVILTIDQVNVTSYGFTDKIQVELVPSDRDRELIEKARNGDPAAQNIAQDIPPEMAQYLETGNLIPLNTDPMKGSCVVPFTYKKDARDSEGQSVLQRCLRDLYFQEKVRQAQSQIADRAMTPRRVVWAEGADNTQVDELREQVDLALIDPDYSIVANYEVHWDEMSSRDRLLDDTAINEQVDQRLYAGLGVTQSLLTGESLYSGDRIKLEIINTKYTLLRELIQEIIEKYIFRPVAIRKGFVEKNEWGDDEPLYPKVSFTRLALKDTQDLYDALFNLYQKGSVPVEVILELFNLDSDDIKEKLKKDVLTLNDPMFNEVLRGAYQEAGRALVEKSDIMGRISKEVGVRMKPEPEAAPAEDPAASRWLSFSCSPPRG